jgi:hypothetical protein
VTDRVNATCRAVGEWLELHDRGDTWHPLAVPYRDYLFRIFKRAYAQGDAHHGTLETYLNETWGSDDRRRRLVIDIMAAWREWWYAWDQWLATNTARPS